MYIHIYNNLQINQYAKLMYTFIHKKKEKRDTNSKQRDSNRHK